MRKVILQEFTTIDGFVAGPNGELNFFDSLRGNHDVDKDLLHFMDTIDTILLGRATYDLFVDFWPTATPDIEMIADQLNTTPKLVFSKTLAHAPWGAWDEAKIAKNNAAEEIVRLKQQPGKNMVLWGSITLAQSLMKAGLIDEYQLRVCPVALGKGIRLFPEDISMLNMKLLETKVYDSGVILMRYETNKESS